MKNKNISSKVLFAVLAVGLTFGFVSAKDNRGLEMEGNRGNKYGWMKNDFYSKFTDRYVENDDKSVKTDFNKNGTVAIRGAKVVSINSSQVVVNATLDNGVVLTWTGNISSTTKVQLRNGEATSTSQVLVGDMVTLKGNILTGSSLVLNLSLLRDVSRFATPTNPWAVKPVTTPTATYTIAQVGTHSTSTNCWLAIQGGVYDVTSYINSHPGGAAMILGNCGKDATTAFATQGGRGGHSGGAWNMLRNYLIGKLVN